MLNWTQEAAQAVTLWKEDLDCRTVTCSTTTWNLFYILSHSALLFSRPICTHKQWEREFFACDFFLFFYFTELYWFCHTSTCICHGYTRAPHPEPHLPRPSPYHSSGSSRYTSPKVPVSCIEPGLAIRFLYDIIHGLMPFSQIIPQIIPLSLPQSPKD